MARSHPRWCSTRQTGRIVTCRYSGGRIVSGQLIALVDEAGSLDMRYHPMNDCGELMTGVCRSAPELLPDGRIRLHEDGSWTRAALSIMMHKVRASLRHELELRHHRSQLRGSAEA